VPGPAPTERKAKEGVEAKMGKNDWGGLFPSLGLEKQYGVQDLKAKK